MKITAWNKLCLLGAFCLTVLFFPACEQDLGKSYENQYSEEESIRDYLAANNYNPDSITFHRGGVIHNGDACWNKDQLIRQMNGDIEWDIPESPEPLPMGAAERQRGLEEENRLHSVSRNNVNTIHYYIRPGVDIFCGAGWRGAINTAAIKWNILPECRVRLIESFSSADADLIFAPDNDPILPQVNRNLPIPLIGLGTFPSNGVVGKWISLNILMAWHPKKIETIMHEVGHNLGFDHTGSQFGQHLFMTPFNESNSIMNSSASNITASFKTGDKRMARLFYPDDLRRPINYSVSRHSAGRVRIIYRNPENIDQPYYWIRITKYTLEGQILAEKFVRSACNELTGLHITTWGGHTPGQSYRFAVRGYNFRRDVWSSRTSKLSVTL